MNTGDFERVLGVVLNIIPIIIGIVLYLMNINSFGTLLRPIKLKSSSKNTDKITGMIQEIVVEKRIHYSKSSTGSSTSEDIFFPEIKYQYEYNGINYQGEDGLDDLITKKLSDMIEYKNRYFKAFPYTFKTEINEYLFKKDISDGVNRFYKEYFSDINFDEMPKNHNETIEIIVNKNDPKINRILLPSDGELPVQWLNIILLTVIGAFFCSHSLTHIIKNKSDVIYLFTGALIMLTAIIPGYFLNFNKAKEERLASYIRKSKDNDEKNIEIYIDKNSSEESVKKQLREQVEKVLLNRKVY